MPPDCTISPCKCRPCSVKPYAYKPGPKTGKMSKAKNTPKHLHSQTCLHREAISPLIRDGCCHHIWYWPYNIQLFDGCNPLLCHTVPTRQVGSNGMVPGWYMVLIWSYTGDCILKNEIHLCSGYNMYYFGITFQ